MHKLAPGLRLAQAATLGPLTPGQPGRHPPDRLLRAALTLTARDINGRGRTCMPKRVAWVVYGQVNAAHLDEFVAEELGAIQGACKNRVLQG